MNIFSDLPGNQAQDQLFSSEHLRELPDISLLKNCPEAANLIFKALNSNLQIMIFGHDDADGLTSTYILDEYLKFCGFTSHLCYIPNRMIENHGISQNLIQACLKNKTELLIVVDNGSTSVEGVEILKQHHIQVIIIDHHLMPDNPPQADLIVNPKQADCQYPDKMLAGVGLVWMLILQLSSLTNKAVPDYLQFWTALGTLADRVPLIQVNRLILRSLFNRWESCTDHPLIHKFLCRFGEINETGDKFSFLLWLIKYFYSGRQENGRHVCLTLMQNPDQFDPIINALDLEIVNSEKSWKSAVDILHEQILAQIDLYLQNQNNPLSDNIHIYLKDYKLISVVLDLQDTQTDYSQIGRLCGIISRYYNIPAMVLCQKTSSHKACEARSPEGFNWLDCFNACSEHLDQYGGHAKAAGFIINNDRFLSFLTAFDLFLQTSAPQKPQQKNNPIQKYKTEWYDSLLLDLQNLYLKLMPFGEKNPSPVMTIFKAKLHNEHRIFFEELSKFSLEEKIFNKKHFNFINSFDKNTEKLINMTIRLNERGRIQVIDFHEGESYVN